MEKRGYQFLSPIVFLLGVFFLDASQQGITGAFLGISPAISSVTGIFLWIMAGILFMVGEGGLEKKMKPHDKITEDLGLKRYAKRALRDQNIEREMKHLEQELAKGHIEAGLGTRHIPDTDVWYMRGSRGSRLFYRQTRDKEGNTVYEIVGKAAGTGKKINENSVIRRLQELYKN